MTTMHQRERLRYRRNGPDLLEQVCDSREERDAVRRILGAETVTDSDYSLARLAAADWRAQNAYSPTDGAARYSACSGPCEQGRKPCPCPESCQEPEREALRAGDLLRVVIFVLASWAAVAAIILAVGWLP